MPVQGKELAEEDVGPLSPVPRQDLERDARRVPVFGVDVDHGAPGSRGRGIKGVGERGGVRTSEKNRQYSSVVSILTMVRGVRLSST